MVATRKMAGSRVHGTRIDLSADTRERMVPLLNQQLADTMDLYSQTKQAHWNVKGNDFWQLHLLFDKLAEDVEAYVDLIAERVTALGGTAAGTVRMAAAASRVPEYDVVGQPGMAHVEALADRYASYAATTREAIDTADDAGDASTADLFTEISRGVDRSLYFLDSHIQK